MLWDARELLVAVMNGRELLTNMTADVLGDLRPGADRRVRSASGREPAEYAAGRADELARLKEEFGKALDARLEGTAETLYTQLFGLSGAGRPSGAPSCLSATSASRTGTSCSSRSSRSPTPASATRSRSSA